MKRGYVVGFALIALCAAAAIYSLKGAATSNVDFARAEQSSDTVQIYGRLLRESVVTNPTMTHVAFQLSEDKSGRKLNLLYDNPGNPVPANFRSATQVRVVGTYDPAARVFHAAQLYTKCPSKYDPGQYKEPGNAQAAGEAGTTGGSKPD